MPARKGVGHDVLIAGIQVSDFDPHIWKQGKNDKVLILLGQIAYQTGMRYTKLPMDKYTNRLIRSGKLPAPFPIKEIHLDFMIPTVTEFMEAVARDRRSELIRHLERVRSEREGCKQSIHNRRALLQAHRNFLQDKTVGPGIRLHYERVLIPDLEKWIAGLHEELEKRRRLVRIYQKRLSRTRNP